MIQRIQSVWLFLAAMILGALFISKLYAVKDAASGLVTHYGVRDAGHIALFILAAIITVLPLVTIFFFTNRKRQKGFVWLSMLGCVGFLALALMKISNTTAALINSAVSYDFGLLLPIVAIVFLFLANAGIRKDETLIRSADRLR